MKIELDPSEEYVILPVRVVEKLIRYALALCQDRCPAERDPEACYYLVQLCRTLGLGRPPCVGSEYSEFTEEVFSNILRDIERKYGMRAQEFLRKVKRRGPKNLEENTDLMEVEFALGVLKVLSSSRRGNVVIVRGSQIRIVSTND